MQWRWQNEWSSSSNQHYYERNQSWNSPFLTTSHYLLKWNNDKSLKVAKSNGGEDGGKICGDDGVKDGGYMKWLSLSSFEFWLLTD